MVVCYLCGKSDHRVRRGSVRDAPALQVLECVACGLVTLSSRDHVRPGHYERSGMHGSAPPAIEAWLREAEGDDVRRFERLKGDLAGRTLLDFGSGAGGFLRRATTIAVQAAGVEPEQRVRDYWRDTLTLYQSLDDAEPGYDIVTAFHVLEHLPDPRATLAALGARLAVGGRLVVEVPNSDDALLTLFENEAFQRFTYWSHHLFLFNADTLRVLVTQAGLQLACLEQYQRYPLSNHLYWMSRGEPGGHLRWSFLDSPEMHAAYTASLAAIGKCDTLIAHITRRSN